MKKDWKGLDLKVYGDAKTITLGGCTGCKTKVPGASDDFGTGIHTCS